jgi:hypothetical protein
MSKIFQLFISLDSARLVLTFPEVGVAVVWNGLEKFSMRSMHTGNEIDVMVEWNVKSEDDAIHLSEIWIKQCYSHYIAE